MSGKREHEKKRVNKHCSHSANLKKGITALPAANPIHSNYIKYKNGKITSSEDLF